MLNYLNEEMKWRRVWNYLSLLLLLCLRSEVDVVGVWPKKEKIGW